MCYYWLASATCTTEMRNQCDSLHHIHITFNHNTYTHWGLHNTQHTS